MEKIWVFINQTLNLLQRFKKITYILHHKNDKQLIKAEHSLEFIAQIWFLPSLTKQKCHYITRFGAY